MSFLNQATRAGRVFLKLLTSKQISDSYSLSFAPALSNICIQFQFQCCSIRIRRNHILFQGQGSSCYRYLSTERNSKVSKPVPVTFANQKSLWNYCIMPRGKKRTSKEADNKKKVEEKEEEKITETEEEKTTPPKKVKKTAKNNKKEESNDEPKPKLSKKNNESISESFGDTDFKMSSSTSSGKEANFKISSWNINGIRAWLGKDGPSYIKSEQPDVLCVQELKCDKSKIPADVEVEGYTNHWLSGDTEGYSGVGIYYKTSPISVVEGIGIEKHDSEGRVITAEFEKFYLVNTYIPNSGRGLVRHKYRTEEWDVDFLEYLKALDKKKPVIWCGDLNVAHQEIDIKNAKGNKKNAGFTQEERDNFGKVLEAGFFDSFRHLYPETEHAYSFWAYFMNARAKNVGWRLDYFVMSERLKENLCDSVLRTKIMGSDHCPIVLELAI